MTKELFYCIFAFISFMLGGALASFAGVVAFRVPKGQSVIKPDSYCPACKKPIKAYDNIPILSYIFLGGRCRSCRASIGIFGFLCELFGATLFALAYWSYGRSLDTLAYMFLLWALTVLFIVIADIDMQSQEIYNSTIVIFGVLSFVLALFRVVTDSAKLWDLIGGALLGFGFFLIIQIVAKLVLKRDALGSGDIFLSGFAGMFLGMFAWLLGILIATLAGSVIELIRIKRKKITADSAVAFGPYLLLGFGIMAVIGERLLDFYWSVMF